ncbi:MAG: hypothetical protein CMI52_02780 [Parcubacteria group bacterium]|nr:hypothetical protein [Parcubacteria group bacterium]
MYIEPNVKMLKKTFMGSTIFLIIVFISFFVFMWGKEVKVEESKVVGLSGELVKEDGVFLVDSQIIFSHEPLDGLVGESVAIVGTLDEEGLLVIDQLLTSPKNNPEIPIESDTTRVTAKSDFSFSLEVPNEWKIENKSKNYNARIDLVKDDNRIIIDRYDDGEIIEDEIQAVPASVSFVPVSINGYPYEHHRAISQLTKRLFDHIVPSEECYKDEKCPRMLIGSNGTNPENAAILNHITKQIVVLPEPQGWKILRHSMKNSDWNFYMYYPPEYELNTWERGYSLSKNNKEYINIHVADEIPGHHITDVGKENTEIIILPTREEKLYHTESPKDGTPYDAMLMRNPDDTQHILVTGRGAGFDAAIRTFVFEEKQ